MITFSGMDCSGKSTQIERIKEYYKARGIACRVIWSRGGYTSWVEGFKTLIRRDKGLTAEEKAEYRKEIRKSSWKNRLYLQASIWDMLRYWGIVYRAIERGGKLIICDRYVWDTCIDFQLRYPEYNFEDWFSWKLMLKCIKKPTHSFVLTIPVEESMRRSELKNDPHPEPYERRVLRVEYYLNEIKKQRWKYVIDSMQPLEAVTADIIQTLEQ